MGIWSNFYPTVHNNLCHCDKLSIYSLDDSKTTAVILHSLSIVRLSCIVQQWTENRKILQLTNFSLRFLYTYHSWRRFQNIRKQSHSSSSGHQYLELPGRCERCGQARQRDLTEHSCRDNAFPSTITFLGLVRAVTFPFILLRLTYIIYIQITHRAWLVLCNSTTCKDLNKLECFS
jgi:hypothetical protein